MVAAKRAVRGLAVAVSAVFVAGAVVALDRRDDGRKAVVTARGLVAAPPPVDLPAVVEEATSSTVGMTATSAPAVEAPPTTAAVRVTTPTSRAAVVPTTLPPVTVPTLPAGRAHPCPGAAPIVGSMGVYTVDASGRLVRLADLGENELVRKLLWSPDGRWVAYRNDDNALAIIRHDGSGRIGVVGVHDATWTRDNRLVFTDSSGLHLLDPATGGTVKNLTPAGEASGALVGLLADGRVLTASNGFMVTSLDGTKGERTDYDIGITWGTIDPTGQRIVYGKYGEPLTILDWSTKRTVAVGASGGPTGGFIAWSPDGSMLAADVDGSTAVFRTDGRVVHRFPAGFFPVWSPRSDALAAGGADLRVFDLSGNQTHGVAAPSQTSAWNPAPSIAFGTLGSDPQHYFMYNDSALCTLDSHGTLRRLATLRRAALAYSMSWSPDGTTLAFTVPTNPDAPYNP